MCVYPEIKLPTNKVGRIILQRINNESKSQKNGFQNINLFSNKIIKQTHRKTFRLDLL